MVSVREPFPSDEQTPQLTFARWVIGSARRWRAGAITGAILAVLIVAAALLLPATYRSEVSFVSNTTDNVNLPAGLAGMAGMSGLAGQLGMSIGGEPSESPAFYVQLVLSRELLTRLLESRFHDPESDSPADSARLVDILELGRDKSHARRMEIGVERLRRAITPNADPRTNLVELSIDMPSAELSAAVANRTVELVALFNMEQRTSRARARRAFVNERLTDADRELRAAEDRYRDFLLQNRQWRSSPTLTAEEGRLDRRVTMAGDLVSTLQREFETARIDEVNDAPMVTPVDSAIPPVRPRWPRPAPLAALALTSALLVGILTSGILTLLAEWATRNPADAAELSHLLPTRMRGATVQGDPAPRAADPEGASSLRAADSKVG